jgi:two-component system sensor histidine kinase KdpD
MADVKSRLPGDVPPTRVADLLSGSPASEMPAVVGYLAALAMTAVATVIAIGIDQSVTIPNLSLIFVVPVVVAGVGFGLGPSLWAALLGALAYNFFLTEPRYSLAVDDAANIWAIGLLFVVGLIVSGVAFTSRQMACDAALLRAQASVLQGYSRDIVAAGNTNEIISITSQALAALFHVPAAVMLFTEGEGVSVNSVGGTEPEEAEFEAARVSLETGIVARAGVYPALTSRFDLWPVATAMGQRAVIGLAFDRDERPSTPGTVVNIVGSVLALALHRQHLRG